MIAAGAPAETNVPTCWKSAGQEPSPSASLAVTGGEAMLPPRSPHAAQVCTPAAVCASVQMSPPSVYCVATWILPLDSWVSDGWPVKASLPEITVHCTEPKLSTSD